jgi:anti-sigma factor RsiW
MNDQWTNRLSEYIDGELDATERAALEAHLATCGQCYATLGELRQVVARAQQLEDAPPAKDLWFGIASRIRSDEPATQVRVTRPPRRRFSFTIPQLLAASIALAVLGGGSVMIALRSATVTPAPGIGPTSGDPNVRPVEWRVQTDVAIAELEEALARNERQMDTSTVRVVRQNLAVIDQAIAQAQRALKNDPGSSYLNLHLANTMRHKIDLLRRANALAAGRS